MNTNVTMYDAVGNIINTAVLSEETLSLYTELNLSKMLIGIMGDAATQYVSKGELVNFTPEEKAAKANLPQGWIWKMPERIAVDTRTLETAKIQEWNKIKATRDIEENKPFLYNNELYDSDKVHIPGAVQLALLSKLNDKPYSIDWTLYDNSVKTLNADEMIAVGIALGTHTDLVYSIARDLRARIDVATTKEELDAIVWPT